VGVNGNDETTKQKRPKTGEYGRKLFSHFLLLLSPEKRRTREKKSPVERKGYSPNISI
jgi:hypothetical protein